MADPLAKERRGGGAAGGSPGGEDAFIEFVYRGWDWVQRNAPAVIGGTVALGIAILVFFYIQSYQRNVEERAAVELQEMRLMATDDAQAAARLESFLQQFGGTDAGAEARVLLGRLHVGAGRYDAALETLEPLTRGSADSPLGYAARQLRAAAFEGRGSLDLALDELRALGERARYGFQRRAARAEQARILAETGRLEEAERIYAGLAEEAEDPAERAMYRIRLGEVRAMLATGFDPTAESAVEPAAEPGSEPDEAEAGTAAADTP